MPRGGGRRWTPLWTGPPLSDAERRAFPVFRDGFKYVGGQRHTITGSRQFRSSNGVTIYTALMWSDGKPSCNCPGWASSKVRDKYGSPIDKTCTHAKQVRAGDNVSLSTLADGTHVAASGEAEPKGRKIIL